MGEEASAVLDRLLRSVETVPGSLAVESRPGRGRCLVWNGAACLKRGDEILREDAFALALYSHVLAKRCDFTLATANDAPSGRLMRCSKTKIVRYAGTQAQKNSWKQYMRLESDVLVNVAPKLPTPTVRLACRLIWRRALEGETDASRLIDSLEDHWDALPDARKVELAHMGAFARFVLSSRTSLPRDPDMAEADEKRMTKLLAILSCNVHTIQSATTNECLGIGLFPVASLANHACEPNCVQSFRGRRIVFRALRPIAPGDELCITYIDLLSYFWDRRNALLTHYCFDVWPRMDAAGVEVGEGRGGVEEGPEEPLTIEASQGMGGETYSVLWYRASLPGVISEGGRDTHLMEIVTADAPQEPIGLAFVPENEEELRPTWGGGGGAHDEESASDATVRPVVVWMRRPNRNTPDAVKRVGQYVQGIWTKFHETAGESKGLFADPNPSPDRMTCLRAFRKLHAAYQAAREGTREGGDLRLGTRHLLTTRIAIRLNDFAFALGLPIGGAPDMTFITVARQMGKHLIRTLPDSTILGYDHAYLLTLLISHAKLESEFGSVPEAIEVCRLALKLLPDAPAVDGIAMKRDAEVIYETCMRARAGWLVQEARVQAEG